MHKQLLRLKKPIGMKKTILFLTAFLCTIHAFGQPASLEGYVFESGNRGFLKNIEVSIIQSSNDSLIGTVLSNGEGYFTHPLPLGEKFLIEAKHDYFHTRQIQVHTLGSAANDKVFSKLELNRAPGYLFDITIAEARDNEDQVVDAIKKSTIEVYNNTQKEMVLHLVDYLKPDFKVHLKKGNHYTIMIRKDGFITKRMEAFVDVKGCILCFEGVGDVRPGVTDNLTEQNSFGTLLANVELERAEMGKEISFLNKIYYERGSAALSEQAKAELEKLKLFLSDNPNLIIELGSHTDSRGDIEKNRQLSFKRAQGAVDFILEGGVIDGSRLLARGYGPSKLSNDCGPGVKCTESEHAINRRTELKILGYVKDYVNRSLASMKQEEFMDELLAEIQAEGQIKVPENEELPSDIREDEEMVEEINSEFDVKSDEVQDAVSSIVSEIEEELVTTPLDTDGDSPAHIQASANEKVEESIVAMDKPDQLKNNATNKVEDVSSQEIPKEEMKEMKDVAKEIPMEITTKVDEVTLGKEAISKGMPTTDTQDLKDDPTGWMSGHKIVLVESKTELAGDHALFKKYDDVHVLQSPVSKKYMYIAGAFKTQVEAQNYVNENLKKKFPEAYVISF